MSYISDNPFESQPSRGRCLRFSGLKYAPFRSVAAAAGSILSYKRWYGRSGEMAIAIA